MQELLWDHSLGLSTSMLIEDNIGCSSNYLLTSLPFYDSHYFFNQIAWADDHLQQIMYPQRAVWADAQELAFDIILTQFINSWNMSEGTLIA